MNRRHPLLFILLRHSPPKGERITMTNRGAKTDIKRLQPPSRKMIREHTNEKGGTQRTRHDGLLESTLLRDLFAEEASIHHADHRGVALDVFKRRSIRHRSNFIADVNVVE